PRSSWSPGTRGRPGAVDAPRTARVGCPRSRSWTHPPAHLGRPCGGDAAVRLEEGERDALQAEADAGRVRDFALDRADAEDLAEVTLVIVERHQRGGALGRADGEHQLVLELLLALVLREELAAAAEEWIVGGRRLCGEAEGAEQLAGAFDPAIAERARHGGAADAHLLPHAEDLHARGIRRRLVPEAVRRHVEEPPRRGQHAGGEGVDRVARCRRQDDVRHGLERRVRPAGLDAIHHLLVLLGVALKLKMEPARWGNDSRNPLRWKSLRGMTGGKRTTSAPSSAQAAVTSRSKRSMTSSKRRPRPSTPSTPVGTSSPCCTSDARSCFSGMASFLVTMVTGPCARARARRCWRGCGRC